MTPAGYILFGAFLGVVGTMLLGSVAWAMVSGSRERDPRTGPLPLLPPSYTPPGPAVDVVEGPRHRR
ncbi:hypothetical protein [Frankia sp. AvcI1]|uniref:hypothetical protein n=1 Tax=Frankia sp. AvcI1 TaxID=573496 RepID=UPI0021196B8F|nr:hypothetical protein [Frankia sp. AvcI1]